MQKKLFHRQFKGAYYLSNKRLGSCNYLSNQQVAKFFSVIFDLMDIASLGSNRVQIGDLEILSQLQCLSIVDHLLGSKALDKDYPFHSGSFRLKKDLPYL